MSPRLPPTRRRLGHRLLVASALALAAPPGGVTPANAAAAATVPSPILLEAVRVDPATASAGTLCQLRVVLRNAGTRNASELAFRVTVNGVELPAYGRRLFMARLEPGESRELRLFNFWTSETSRPAPADGRYTVEVGLVAARWFDIETGSSGETWSPREPVGGLPATRAVSWTAAP
jgi:hypothetical protein